MAVSVAILAHAFAVFLPLELSLNSNRPKHKSRTKNAEKPPETAVFLRKMVGVRGLEPRASCSQMCVGTFRQHSTALFGPFLCLGSSSLELFCPACFKKPFRLLGFVRDWILCIKRCSARFEGQWQAGSPQWRGAGIAPHKQRIRTWCRDIFYLKMENMYETEKTRSENVRERKKLAHFL